MKTVFISGNDTDIGKTWVMRTLTDLLSATNRTIQVVKPLECGVPENENGDVDFAINGSDSSLITGHTFYSMKKAVAPVDAGGIDGVSFSLSDICEKINSLPDCDWRIIEGAGGIAVPVDNTGVDWADFAKAIKADYTVLVVENRLGFINQSRLLDAYMSDKNLNAGIWINEVKATDELVKKINLNAAENLSLPVWGIQDYGNSKTATIKANWLREING